MLYLICVKLSNNNKKRMSTELNWIENQEDNLYKLHQNGQMKLFANVGKQLGPIISGTRHDRDKPIFF